VDHAVAVDPDEKLKDHARKAGWPIISLRNGICPTDHFHK
jgi:phosphoserine phosphatase